MNNNVARKYVLFSLTLLFLLLQLMAVTGCRKDQRTGSNDTDSLATLPQTIDYPDSLIIGEWVIDEALTLEGEPYNGTVTIIPDSHYYRISWETSLWKREGIALKYGSILLAGWSKGVFGLHCYTIYDDGRLSAFWASNESNGLGKEKAVGGQNGLLEGFYSITTEFPSSDSTDMGQLIIERLDYSYELKWVYPGNTYNGLGLRAGKMLFAGSGNDNNFGITLYRFDNGSAEGKKLHMNRKTIAVENLVRK